MRLRSDRDRIFGAIVTRDRRPSLPIRYCGGCQPGLQSVFDSHRRERHAASAQPAVDIRSGHDCRAGRMGLKTMAMLPKSKFVLSLDYFKEIEQRAHAYPLPPEGFDPLPATDAQLDWYGLPPRPNRETEPDLYQFWTRLLSKPF